MFPTISIQDPDTKSEYSGSDDSEDTGLDTSSDSKTTSNSED